MIAQRMQLVLTDRAPAPDEDIAHLARALHTETRLLCDLTETLRRQREGVARDDVGAVDDSVFGAHRVLRTLGEARRRRRGLLEQILGAEDLPLSAWSDAFGSWLTPELRDACSRAQVAAETLAREIEINRAVLRSALAANNGFIRALAGGPATAVAYSAESASPVEVARGGALIDREV